MTSPDYMKGQYIYESLQGMQEADKTAEVLKQLVELYPNDPEMEGYTTYGALYFMWWTQARTSGVIK